VRGTLLRLAGLLAGLMLLVNLALGAESAPLFVSPTSPAAIMSAARGFNLANIDPTCKPCQDFFRYAMGGWHADNPIPATASRWSVLDQLRGANRASLHDILEDVSHDAWPHGSPGQKAGDYYASCMNVRERDLAGLGPIQVYVHSIRAIKDLSDVRLQTAVLQNIGAKPFFFAGTEGDPRDEQRTIAFIAQGGLGLPDRALYFAPDARADLIRNDYVAHVTRDFRLLGDDLATSYAEAHAVIAVEIELARGSRTRAALRDRAANYHKMTLAEAQLLIPSFDLSLFLRDRMASNVDAIDVSQPEYFRNLDTVLRNTPVTELRAYLLYRLIERASPALTMSFSDEADLFDGSLVGRHEQQPLWYRCVRSVDTDLPDALGQLYVEREFSPETRVEAKHLISTIQTTLRDDLSTLGWMSESTRHEALAKLDAIADHVGYPESWRSYETVNIDRGTFLDNSLRLSLYRARNTFTHLGRNVSREFWSMSAPTVNASYSAAYNDITFPAGLLQPPFFSTHFDDATNFGALGVIVAHELTHAFDDEGRRSDAQGNLRDWWQPADAAAWSVRANCVAREYGELHENDKLIIGEALADLGGAEIAYDALERSLAGKPRTKIDGWTPEQRFFLAFAQTYSTFDRPERMRLDEIVDPHPDGRDRVLGTLINMPQFAAAFDCHRRDPMYRAPAQRCGLW
jgi:putative endopeptidase